MDKEKLEAVKRKNRTIVAKFLSLSLKHSDKKKCLITFTPNDERYESVKEIKKYFVSTVKKILRRQTYKNSTFAYFAVVEFGKDILENWNPHLHVQVFYTDVDPIIEAFEEVVEKFKLDLLRCNLSIAKNNNVNFSYVVKNFQVKNFDLDLEKMKIQIYKGKAIYWASHKNDLPNYLIRSLYKLLSCLPSWKSIKDKYGFIIDLISKKKLIIKKSINVDKKGFKRVNNFIYKLNSNSVLYETSPYKIKNTHAHKNTNIPIKISSFFIKIIFILSILKPKIVDLKQSNQQNQINLLVSVPNTDRRHFQYLHIQKINNDL